VCGDPLFLGPLRLCKARNGSRISERWIEARSRLATG
jgi:hypothetical protein